MTTISSRATALELTDIRKISNRIYEEGLDAVRLDIGEPDLPCPAHVVEAAARSAAAGAHYTASNGTLALRRAVCAALAERHGDEVDPGDVVVTVGATGALCAAMLALVDPGDEVLVPVPGYPNYTQQLRLVGGVPVGYPLHAELGWTPTLDEIAAAITGRTRAIVLNSPSNPTGGVVDQETLAGIVALAREHDLWIVADEVYDELVFEGEALDAIGADRERVVGVYSVSKTYSMTGWRVGFAVVPPALAPVLTRVNAQLVSSASSVAQDAALAALTGPQDGVAVRRDTYRARRDFTRRRAAELGFPAGGVPRGAFYYALGLPAGTDSFATAMELLDGAGGEGVATIPGRAFGEPGLPYLRLSLTRPEADIARGLEIVAKHVLP